MKIRYLEPQPKGATIYEIANLPKLGLPLLASCTRDWDDTVDQWIYCELIRGVKIDWDDVLSSDLVCISTTTNTTLEGYEYAARCRAAGIPVVFGGSHVTFMAQEALKHNGAVTACGLRACRVASAPRGQTSSTDARAPSPRSTGRFDPIA